jgi:ubiquinone/menaquinone biosynthesis C-methylase UbiE
MTIVQLLSLVRIGFWQRLLPQRLERTPEPEMLMEMADQVRDYHQAAQTSLDLIYCVAVELIAAWLRAGPTRAIDLGCGTGDATRRLVWGLGLKSVLAIDGSAAMVEHARRNLAADGLDALVEVRLNDIRQLDYIGDDAFDLSCCLLTAHHLDNIDAVGQLLDEMNRVTQPDGLVFLLDLARLKSRSLVDRYVQTFSAGQSDLHNEDFLNSMLAAFTIQELAAAIPGATKGKWLHFAGPIVPSLQVAMRVPPTANPLSQPRWAESPVAWVSTGNWRRIRDGFLLAAARRARRNIQAG